MQIKSGNDVTLKVLVKDSDDTIIDNLADADEIIFQLKETKEGSAFIEKKETDGDITVNDPSMGYLKISLSGSDTASLSGNYYIAIEVQWTDNKQEMELQEEVDGYYNEIEQLNIKKDVIQQGG